MYDMLRAVRFEYRFRKWGRELSVERPTGRDMRLFILANPDVDPIAVYLHIPDAPAVNPLLLRGEDVRRWLSESAAA